MEIKFIHSFNTTKPYEVIDFIPCRTEGEFEKSLAPNCFALVDYGALNFIGQSGMVDHLDRFMIHTIEENPSVQFIFILTMGAEYYADEIFEFPNVKTLDRCCDLDDWKNILNPTEAN